MRYLLIFMFFINTAYAQFVSKSDLNKANNGAVSYARLKDCESKRGEECFDLRGLNLETHSLVDGKLKLDSVKKSIFDAKVQARKDKEQAGKDRKQRMTNAITNWDALTDSQKLDVLKDVALETIQ